MTGTRNERRLEEGTTRRRTHGAAVVAKATCSTVTSPSSPPGLTSVTAESLPVDNSPVVLGRWAASSGTGTRDLWIGRSEHWVHPQMRSPLARCTRSRPEMEATRSEPSLTQGIGRER